MLQQSLYHEHAKNCIYIAIQCTALIKYRADRDHISRLSVISFVSGFNWCTNDVLLVSLSSTRLGFHGIIVGTQFHRYYGLVVGALGFEAAGKTSFSAYDSK